MLHRKWCLYQSDWDLALLLFINGQRDHMIQTNSKFQSVFWHWWENSCIWLKGKMLQRSGKFIYLSRGCLKNNTFPFPLWVQVNISTILFSLILRVHFQNLKQLRKYIRRIPSINPTCTFGLKPYKTTNLKASVVTLLRTQKPYSTRAHFTFNQELLNMM